MSALTWSISPPLAIFSTIDASKFEVSFSTDVDRMDGIAAYLISEVWRKVLGRGGGLITKGGRGEVWIAVRKAHLNEIDKMFKRTCQYSTLVGDFLSACDSPTPRCCSRTACNGYDGLLRKLTPYYITHLGVMTSREFSSGLRTQILPHENNSMILNHESPFMSMDIRLLEPYQCQS